MTKDKDDFNQQDSVDIIQEKNKDLVIEALESLLEKKIIISSVQASFNNVKLSDEQYQLKKLEN